jgi:ribosomal protein S18 acetylase RimI-like enzyme
LGIPWQDVILERVFEGSGALVHGRRQAFVLQGGFGSTRNPYLGGSGEGRPFNSGDFIQGFLQSLPEGQRPDVYYLRPPHYKGWIAPSFRRLVPLLRSALENFSQETDQSGMTGLLNGADVTYFNCSMGSPILEAAVLGSEELSKNTKSIIHASGTFAGADKLNERFPHLIKLAAWKKQIHHLTSTKLQNITGIRNLIVEKNNDQSHIERYTLSSAEDTFVSEASAHDVPGSKYRYGRNAGLAQDPIDGTHRSMLDDPRTGRFAAGCFLGNPLLLTERFPIRRADLEADLETLVKHNLKMWELDRGEDRPDQHGIHRAFFNTHRDVAAFIAEDPGDQSAAPNSIGTVIAYERHADMPTMGTPEKRGIIALLYVDKEYRCQGVGRALMRRAIEHLAKVGCEKVGLYATPEGRRLYEKMDFIPDSEMRLIFNTTEQPLPSEIAKRPVLSPVQDMGESAAVTVRKADPKEEKTVQILVDHAKLASSTESRDDGNAVAAYREFFQQQPDAVAFIAEKGGVDVGSTHVAEWKYPVPRVFTGARRDLFIPRINASDPEVVNALIEASIDYGKNNGFTGVDVDTVPTRDRKLFEAHDFTEGIKMTRDSQATARVSPARV